MRSFALNISTLGSIDPILGALGATESQVQLASMRALNKVAVWLKGHSAQAISEQKRIQQKLIRERLKIIKANRSHLTAYVVASLRGMRACDLGHMRQTTSGVSVGQYDFKGAFIATMPTGHDGVFKRKGKQRLPIREVVLPLEPVASKAIESLVDTEAGIKFIQFFRHELGYLLKVKL